MIKLIGNILIKFILKADSKVLKDLHHKLINNVAEFERNAIKERYDISTTFKLNGNYIKFYGNGKIICGNNSYIGEYSTVQAFDNCEVIIGNNCAISHNVRIYTHSYVSNQDFNDIDVKKYKVGSVRIGNGVWIGANVFINPGITIGDNAIIGANSVITKDIAPNTINGGVPARLIKEKK
jgi:maltose O-acetyltransferase